MTGEKKRDDDSDFLDDDFVVEDIAGKGEDLDQLFDMPGKPKKAAPAGGSSPAGGDVEDVLFTDHTKGLDPSFEATPEFAESGESTWTGEGLELDTKGKPKSKKGEGQTPEEGEGQDEEFELDSEEQLEVVGGATEAGDGIEQFENSGPFTVEETEHGQEVEASLSDNEGPAQPGWEPLPATDMDALQEGAELARVEQPGYEEEEGELVGAGIAGSDGHEVVADADQTDRASIRPIGPVRWETNRRGRLVASAAVLLLLFSTGAVVVFRPELVGLELEPPRVEQAKVLRPTVAIEVAVPKLPVSSDPQAPTQPPVVAGDPPKPQPPVVPVVVDPKPQPPVVEPKSQGPQNPTVPVVVVVPAPDSMPQSGPWPVSGRPAGVPGVPQGGLIRVSDDLKIGDHTAVPPPSAYAVQGVMPGSKAFAQLHNGNYFIGVVKNADAKNITLKLEDEGEITLLLDAIARLTELGSADYAELQKVTAGFVRLTNNNRLVGGILSQIADDHVILEFRKNRVMVPRSAIGALVEGDDDLTVRLDTTREEDDWLRKLAERELGTGQPMMPPSPKTHKPELSTPPRPAR